MSENADLKLYADMDGLLLKINDLLLALEALLGKLPAVAGDDGREKLITLIVQLREQRAWYERTLREKMESLKGSGVMIPGLIGAVSASPVANYASYGKLWWLSRKARKQVRDGLKGKRGTDSETGSVIPSTPEELEASLNDYFKSALVLTHEGEGASEELRSQMETLGGMVRTSARLVNGVTDIPDITLHRRGSWGHDGAAPAPGETQDLKT